MYHIVADTSLKKKVISNQYDRVLFCIHMQHYSQKYNDIRIKSNMTNRPVNIKILTKFDTESANELHAYRGHIIITVILRLANMIFASLRKQ